MRAGHNRAEKLRARLAAAALALLFLPGPSPGVTLYEKDQFKLKLTGHFQDLTSSSQDPFFGGHVTDNTQRLRLAFRALTGTMVSADASIDTTYTFGSVLDSPLFRITKDMPPPTYFNWQRAYIDENGRYGKVSVYRAVVTVEAENYRIVLGRQRLAYGAALFWSPIDIWNPTSPLALEPDEKAGVDGVSGIWYINERSSATALAAIADTWDETRAAASWSFQYKSYTFDFLAGKHGRDMIYGMDFVGYVGTAGLHGEFTYTVADRNDDFPRAVIGMDYAWKNSLYAAVEYYHNGGPLQLDLANPLPALDAMQSATGVDTVHRNFLGLLATYDLDPLVKGSLAVIADLDKGSEAFAPSLSWSAAESVTASGGVQLFRGAENGEYGSYPDQGWFRLRYDF